MVKRGYVPGRTHPADRARGETVALPAAVAAPWQSCPDHPLVRMETAAPGPGHAMSLSETPSETFITSATVVLGELVTIGVLHAIKNVKQRPFYHWLKDNYGHLFPKLPERTRLFRRLAIRLRRTGPATSWPSLPSWASPTATASDCAIQCAPDVISTNWAGRASPITVGSLGASSAS